MAASNKHTHIQQLCLAAPCIKRLLYTYTACPQETLHVLLQKAICGRPVSAVLHIVDAFGNATLTGGADVSAQLQTPEGVKMSEVSHCCF